MSLITIIVHSASGLPDKLGLLKACSPSVKLYVGTGVWESKKVDRPGANCSWEEQSSFTWDGSQSLAIDMMSRDTCFAKAFVNLNDYIGRQPRFSGTIQLNPEKCCDTRPALNVTMMRNTGGATGPSHGGNQPGFGGPQPGFGGPQPGFGGPQPGFGGPQPGFGGPQPGFGGPQPGFGGHQPGFGGPQPGFGGPQHGPHGYGRPGHRM